MSLKSGTSTIYLEILDYRYVFLSISYSVDIKKRYVEILNFRHFHRHIVFTDEGKKMRNKELRIISICLW